LRAEIAARHETEAVLDERNRLASELHDTLEQGLTGIAMQLEAAARGNEATAPAARRHLELARTMIRQSQAEVRRSVWNLRSQVLDEHDLTDAIRISITQMVAATPLEVRFEQINTPIRLPEMIENNLLRLVQEAVTNVLKHAGASLLTIRLEYETYQLKLVITDNGRGFDEATIPTPDHGHFGLSGMHERMKRIGGKLHILGRAGEGTTIEATIPIEVPFLMSSRSH